MASLSGKTTAGEQNWKVYVVDRSDRASTDYLVESPGYVYTKTSPSKQTDILAIAQVGDKVRITSATINNVMVTKGPLGRARTEQCAQVRYNGKTGYLKLTSIRKPTSAGDAAEKRTLSLTQSLLEQLKEVAGVGRGGTSSFNITVPGLGPINGISGIKKVTTRPLGREAKADFALTDRRGKEILYISHKQGATAAAFQQYGGVSEQSGTPAKPRLIMDDPEVQQFFDDMYSLYEDAKMGLDQFDNNPFSGGRLNKRIFRYLGDPTLISRSVYGPDFGRPFGPDNVHLLGQGEFIFTPIVSPDGDITFQLTFSGPMEINGVTTPFTEVNNPYRAIIVARFTSGRRIVSSKGNIENVRCVIAPAALAGAGVNIDTLL
jgi:hypothetical protein